MTLSDMNKDISIPRWMATVLIAIAIALIGFLWKQAHVQGQIIEQVKQIRIDLDAHIIITRSTNAQLAAEKADRREMDRMYIQLDRIESYLKNH